MTQQIDDIKRVEGESTITPESTPPADLEPAINQVRAMLALNQVITDELVNQLSLLECITVIEEAYKMQLRDTNIPSFKNGSIKKNPIARRLTALLSPKYCETVTIIVLENHQWGIKLDKPTNNALSIFNADEKREVRIGLGLFKDCIPQIAL